MSRTNQQKAFERQVVYRVRSIALGLVSPSNNPVGYPPAPYVDISPTTASCPAFKAALSRDLVIIHRPGIGKPRWPSAALTHNGWLLIAGPGGRAAFEALQRLGRGASQWG